MKKVILYVATVCSALCMNSCSDYLDKNPLNSPSDQTFLATETEMQMALASCYTALWTDFETMTFFLSFDEASDIGYDRNTSALQTMALPMPIVTSQKIIGKLFMQASQNVIIFYKTCLEVKIT